MVLFYERRLLFSDSTQSDPQANKRESQPGVKAGIGGLSDQMVNNGRVPKQVILEAVKTVSSTTLSATVTTGTTTSNVPSIQSRAVSPQTINPERTNPVKDFADLPKFESFRSVKHLQEFMRSHNSAPILRNQHAYPLLEHDGIVLLVQVHKRVKYLRLLFESLKAARGIETILLVISHDFYSDEMNQLVKTVDFCRVSRVARAKE